MRIDHMRGDWAPKAESKDWTRYIVVSGLLGAALVCSVASIFVAQHTGLALAAVVLLGLGLLFERVEERRRWRG